MSSHAIILSKFTFFDGFKHAPALNGLHADQIVKCFQRVAVVCNPADRKKKNTTQRKKGRYASGLQGHVYCKHHCL